MKTSFMYIFLFIIFIIAVGNILVKREKTRNFLLSHTISIMNAFDENNSHIKTLTHLNIIRYKLMSENIFVELPEDKVELEKEEVNNDEVIYEDYKVDLEQIDDTQVKSVTLDWKNEIRNETKYKIDIDKLKAEPLKFSLKKKDTEVIIYHTHTTETYSKDANLNYEASGEFRTLDKNANVVRVGERLKECLEKADVKVYHDMEYYDYPSYNLSYSKAGKAILNLTKKYAGAKVILDVHRDALGTGNQIYRPIININGKDTAQILLVVGTNQGGLNHPNWRENLKFALKLQQKANEKYPGFCRYVSLRKERFNQQVSKGAIIVEMGATGNTMDEVLRATELFSEILLEVAE